MNTYQKIFEQTLQEASEKANNALPKDKINDFLDSTASNFIHETIPEIAARIVFSLRESSEEHLELVREYQEGFVDRNAERWEKGFNALEILIIVCTETGEEFNNTHREKAIQDRNIQFDLVVRLHARSCHIASEIFWLLKGGFADAALARWRALHEVVVTALFLLNHGNELAIRYYEHETIESYKAMKQFNRYKSRLSVEEFSEEELIECKVARDEAINKYGQAFEENYGWAADALNNKRPNFFNLEEAVNLDHLRPYYKWASQNVHANVHGIRNKLGLAEAKEDVLLAGASNSGMTDPADLTALSLSQISVGLLTIYSNMDALIAQYVIKELSSNIGDLFLEIQTK